MKNNLCYSRIIPAEAITILFTCELRDTGCIEIGEYNKGEKSLKEYKRKRLLAALLSTVCMINSLHLPANGVQAQELNTEDTVEGENAISDGEDMTVDSAAVSENTPGTGDEQKLREGRGTQDGQDAGDMAPDIETEDGAIVLSDGVWIEGFEREGSSLTYTGRKITQNLRLYHEDVLLKEKTDYVLTYRNNINAARHDSPKAPSVTITMKGQYNGRQTLYFTIAPRDIGENSILSDEQVISYSKKLTLPAPKLYTGSKKLTLNKDFVCDYSSLPENYRQGDAYILGKTYEYAVYGRGNYTGSRAVKLVVIQDRSLDFNRATITLNRKQYEYCGKALSAEDVRVVRVKLGGKILDAGLYEYQVYADNAGTGYVEVYPSEAGENAGYRGRKKQKINVVGDRSIKDTILGSGWQSQIPFTQKRLEKDGGFLQEKTGVLTYGEEALTEGIDYTVKYSNHKKVGKAAVTFIGTGRYKGSIRKSFNITANTQLQIKWHDMNAGGTPVASYMKGGARPQFDLLELSEGEVPYVLNSKTDYTVKLKNNRKPGIMICEIIGIGNYTGYRMSAEVEVISGDIAKGRMIVGDKQYSSKPNGWKSTVKILDIDGKQLKAGVDYDRNLIYHYDGIESGVSPAAGTVVYVTALGINNYAGTSIVSSYNIYRTHLNKLIVKIDPQEYTGKEIELSTEDIHVYANRRDAAEGKEMESPCYEIVGYSKNTKVGAARVMLRGTGDYGGSRTCSFKITRKQSLIPVISFSLNTETINGYEGERVQLRIANMQPVNATYKPVEWESTNPEAASVDENGLVSLNKAGMAVIKVSVSYAQAAGKCLVIVSSKEETKPEGSYLTPQMFRTDEEEDDTRAFNEAVNHLTEECNTLYVPAGTYRIDAEVGINLRSNTNLVLSSGAVLQAIGNSSMGYTMINVSNASNVTISGGNIVGERYSHGSSAGEWGMGIGLYDSSNITISNVRISDCWGDGIYIGSRNEYAHDAGCTNISIRDCTLVNNRRNNLSIVSADYVTVDGCAFNNANGTAPEYGIDIETNNVNNPCQNITIANSTFDGNAQGSIGIITPANEVRIVGCTLNGNFFNYAGTNVILSNTAINGEMNSRIPVQLADQTTINDGETEADVLVASFSTDKEAYSLGEYRIDDTNTMLNSVTGSESSPSGKVLRLERLSTGDHEAGCYLNLSELTKGAAAVLEAGSTYRFEYVVKGSGQWGIKTDQTGWYPIVPSADEFGTGVVTYEAGSASLCRLILYAVDMTKGMHLEVDTIHIYKVR